MNDLTEDQLYQILTESRESILFQYEDAFDSYDIKLNFTEEALREIATQAFKEKTGARSLMTIIEKSLREFKFELPSLAIDSLEVSLELINNPKEILQKMIKEYSKLQ